jgi:hypothetical protein
VFQQIQQDANRAIERSAQPNRLILKQVSSNGEPLQKTYYLENDEWIVETRQGNNNPATLKLLDNHPWTLRIEPGERIKLQLHQKTGMYSAKDKNLVAWIGGAS